MIKFPWVAYTLAIAAWNTIFTGLLVGVFNITYACSGHSLLSKLDILLIYMIGFIVLFALNVRIVDDDI